MLLALAVAAAPSCAARLMELPSGGGLPASDGVEVVEEATAACSRVESLVAAVAVRGSVAGRRVRVSLEVGVARPAQARIEALAPIGPPLFVFAASAGHATLLLPRDRRVLEDADPAAVLEAVAGVPLDAEALRLTLTGCAAAAKPDAALAFGDEWRMVPGNGQELYFRREDDRAWRLLAAVHHDGRGAPWRAEYRDFADGLPRSIRLTSANRRAFDLRLALSQVELNAGLGPEAFRIDVPPGTAPITFEELRRGGPLGVAGS